MSKNSISELQLKAMGLVLLPSGQYGPKSQLPPAATQVKKDKKPKTQGTTKEYNPVITALHMKGFTIQIPPLSVNNAWQGRRFKTETYENYEKALLDIFPDIHIPLAPYAILLVYGFSNKASDVDNPTKSFTDCLSKKYGFNDKEIYSVRLIKKIVPKGEEFVEFKIKTYNPDDEVFF